MGQHLLDILFSPPPIPPIELPLPAKLIPGVKMAIDQAFKLAYYRGVYDGLIAGVLITMLLLPSIRKQIAKGAAHAPDIY